MKNSLLLDTNLLVLLVVGLNKKELIDKHKRSNSFTLEDFDLLVTILSDYQELWLTNQVVAECSNLLRHTNRKHATQLMQTLSGIVAKSKETNMSSKSIFKEEVALTLGITDAGLVKKSKRVTNLLTVDLDLYLEVSRKHGNAINFNHKRTAGAWDL